MCVGQFSRVYVMIVRWGLSTVVRKTSKSQVGWKWGNLLATSSSISQCVYHFCLHDVFQRIITQWTAELRMDEMWVSSIHQKLHRDLSWLWNLDQLLFIASHEIYQGVGERSRDRFSASPLSDWFDRPWSPFPFFADCDTFLLGFGDLRGLLFTRDDCM